MSLKAGDVVRLKSGSTKMTIGRIMNASQSEVSYWHHQENKLVTKVIGTESLELADN